MLTQRCKRIVLLAVGLLISLAAQAQTQPDVTAKPSQYGLPAMILALLALIGLVVLWWQSRQVLATLARAPEKNKGAISNNEFRELSGRVTLLERDKQQMVGQIKRLEIEVRQLSEKVVARNETRSQPVPAAQNAPQPVSPQHPSAPANRPTDSGTSQQRMMQPQRPAVVNTLPAKLYARTADVPGGFSVGSLIENPNRPMVFIITPTGPGQATFRVTDDPEAQRLALSDPYSYLSDACNYQSRPEANSRIQTLTDGRLQLQGEKWQIIDKAEISFFA